MGAKSLPVAVNHHNNHDESEIQLSGEGKTSKQTPQLQLAGENKLAEVSELVERYKAQRSRQRCEANCGKPHPREPRQAQVKVLRAVGGAAASRIARNHFQALKQSFATRCAKIAEGWRGRRDATRCVYAGDGGGELRNTEQRPDFRYRKGVHFCRFGPATV